MHIFEVISKKVKPKITTTFMLMPSYYIHATVITIKHYAHST